MIIFVLSALGVIEVNNHSSARLTEPFVLRNGVQINNRLIKAALSEALGNTDGRPSAELIRLYRTWSQSEVAILITGNVMIDHRALGEPGNVIVEDERHLKELKEWATVAQAGGSQVWMQINHPGKQAIRGLNRETVAPSAIPFSTKLQAAFATPRELTTTEIKALIQRYATTAAIAQKAGFSGVQLHGAHGYLISQFLSPHHNRRNDQWGGSPENRRRFVLEIYKAVRARVGLDFPIGIKLNSADFQKGGFTEEESLATICALDEVGIDLIEISGGTYEKPAMLLSGKTKASTVAREAYFLEFARKVRRISSVPLMVTGGFRSVAGIQSALSSGDLDLVGLGRIFAIEPLATRRLLNGLETCHQVKPLLTGIKFIDDLGSLEITWYTRQMHRIGKGIKPIPDEHGLKSFLLDIKDKGFGIVKNRKLRAN